MKKIIIEGISSPDRFLKLLEEVNCRENNDFKDVIVKKSSVEIVCGHNSPIKENYLILNIDNHKSFDFSKYNGFTVITIGFNSKASVTVSSVEDEEIVLCIQRKIATCKTIILPQEYVIKNIILEDGNRVINCLALLSMLLIMEKDVLDTNKYF